MKVLLLSYRMPFRRRDGGAKAVYHSALQILQSGAEVKMLAINPSRDHVEDIHYDRKFAKAVRFEKVDVNTNRTIIGALLALLNFRCYIIRLCRFFSRERK